MSNTDNNENPLIGYTPPAQEPLSSLLSPTEEEKEEIAEKTKDNSQKEKEEQTTPQKKQIEKLMEVVHENIKLLFKDQYEEAFAKIFVKDHDEI